MRFGPEAAAVRHAMGSVNLSIGVVFISFFSGIFGSAEKIPLGKYIVFNFISVYRNKFDCNKSAVLDLATLKKVIP